VAEVPQNCFALAGKPEMKVPYFPPPSHLKRPDTSAKPALFGVELKEAAAEGETNTCSPLREILTMSSTESESTVSSIPCDEGEFACHQESVPATKSKVTLDSHNGGGYGKSLFRTGILCVVLFALLNFLLDAQVNTSEIQSSEPMAVKEVETNTFDILPSYCFSVYYDVDEKTETCTLTPSTQAQITGIMDLLGKWSYHHACVDANPFAVETDNKFSMFSFDALAQALGITYDMELLSIVERHENVIVSHGPTTLAGMAQVPVCSK
jgi:hypothetical protein